MDQLLDIPSLAAWRQAPAQQDASLGLVPTMGALHEGHLQLVRKAKKENLRVLVTVFVNPVQFNNAKDLAAYPQNLEADLQVLQGEKVDAVFAPQAQEIYPEPPTTRFDFGSLSRRFDGEHRPGHFSGVALVVCKLFHLVQPSRAYFGQKDFQQLQIIRRLVADLSFPVEIKAVHTQREASGLAMSSRNQRLSEEQKEQAAVLYQALQSASKAFAQGAAPAQVEAAGRELLDQAGLKVDYFAVANRHTLEDWKPEDGAKDAVLLVAAWVGEVRLIDNLLPASHSAQ